MAGGLGADFGTKISGGLAAELESSSNKAPVSAQMGGQLAFGVPGPAGGHYTPEVTQPSGNELQFAFVPSKADMPEVKPVTVKLPAGTGSGGTSFEIDETLSLKDGVLSVNTTNEMEQDNTLPITSAGVFATVGNISAILDTI